MTSDLVVGFKKKMAALERAAIYVSYQIIINKPCSVDPSWSM